MTESVLKTAVSWLGGDGVIAMAAPAQGSPNIWVQLLPFAIVLGIFYFVILMPMRRRQQKVQAFLAALKVGDNIVTTGGMYGAITRLGDDSVQIQIAERVRVEISRNAIVGYQGQEPVTSEKA